MAGKNSPTQELWGWLIPGLGILGIGVLISTQSANVYAFAVALAGAAMCIYGVVKHEQGKAHFERE